MPYIRKQNVLSVSLNKYFILFNKPFTSGLIFIVYYIKNHYRKHFVDKFCLYFLHTALGAVLWE